MPAVSGQLFSLAEDPIAHVPLGPGEVRISEPRYVVWLGPLIYPGLAVVQRLRMAKGDVEHTVDAVRALLAGRGVRSSTWEVGPSATPRGLPSLLLGLGMRPDAEDPLLTGMVATRPPPAPQGAIRVRRVSTAAEFRVALEIQAEAFGVGAAGAEEGLSHAEEHFQAEERSGHVATYLAFLEGEPVATGRATFTRGAVVLNGGSTVPRARGRGAYGALVRARWDEAARRGTPVLLTHARAASRPILGRLGFEEVAQIQVLTDDTD